MDFGVVLQNDPPAWRVVDIAKQAENYGFSHVWTFDSHLLWQEPFVVYSQILANTHRVTVGPMVTNPATRDWTVTASLFATLNDMFGNRTVCGIGRGDSAVRVINGKPVTLATLRESIGVIRGLANGESGRLQGQPAAVPVGRLVAPADLGGGLRPQGAGADGRGRGRLHPAARRSGHRRLVDRGRAQGGSRRRPRSGRVTICVAAPAYVTDGTDAGMEHARDQCRWFGGMVGNHVADIVARYGADGAAIPPALTDYIAGRQGYDYNSTARPATTHTDFVPDEVIDRFCLLGPVETTGRAARGAAGAGRRPVRALPAARRQGRDASRVRRARDARGQRARGGQAVTDDR